MKNKKICLFLCIAIVLQLVGCGGDVSLHNNISDDPPSVSEVTTVSEEVTPISEVIPKPEPEPEPAPPTEEEIRRSWAPVVEIAESPELVDISSNCFEEIDRIISRDIENGFSSAQLAVIKDNKLVCQNTWGYVNSYNPDGTLKEDRVPATNDTLYDLASNTKMYTVNYAIQYLVTHDALDINTRICDILGDDFYEDTIEVHYLGYEFPGLETEQEWKSRLTIRDVLCHEAGFPADPRYHSEYYDPSIDKRVDAPVNPLYMGAGADDKTREQTLKMLFKTPLMYEPGTQTVYSDVDYMLLSFVIEKITGQDLESFLKTVFWEPMELDHICFNPLKNGFSPNDCAATELNGNTRDGAAFFEGIRTYTLQGEVHDEKAWYCMAGVSGHAGLFSSATDLALLANLMLNGSDDPDKAFFSDEVIKTFTSPKDEAHEKWGIGWWLQGPEKERAYYFSSVAPAETFGHQGWTGTLTCIDPTRNLVIVFLTNKINSPVKDPAADADVFTGSSYTTASLSFVPKLIMEACK
ncbi:MAG: penicillin binding protein PBP4B [Lachnospiraceae bacterium]|nr:penicillin binding protein PBP4B [Lachnospiraceae bacterium]